MSAGLSSPAEVESLNALWGGAAAAAVHGQVFPSTDANDAPEEELESESWTRGERGPKPPHHHLNLKEEKKRKEKDSNWAIKLYFCRGTWSAVVFILFLNSRGSDSVPL